MVTTKLGGGMLSYEDYMFDEDKKIADNIVRRKFGYYKRFREDLIQHCIICLWQYRMKYYDVSKGEYEKGAKTVCTQSIIRATRSEQWRFENSLLAFDMSLSDNENSPTAETLHDVTTKSEAEQHYDNTTQDFYEVNAEIEKMKFYKNEKTQEILALFFQGYKEEEVAGKIGCRRQYITRIKSKYKEAFAEIRNKLDNEIREIG